MTDTTSFSIVESGIAPGDDIQRIVGNPADFAIGYSFLGEDGFTILAMYVNGRNLMGFTNADGHFTTRWAHLEGLVAWLRNFASDATDDPYPIEVQGEFAAQKDDKAREFDSEDIQEFEAYYGRINEWAWNHTWAHESSGAVLSNIFFEVAGDAVELSWDNRVAADDIAFDCEFGGARVDAETFKKTVLEFVEAYEQHWGIKTDDDSTGMGESR